MRQINWHAKQVEELSELVSNCIQRSPKHSSRVRVGLQLPLGTGIMKRGHGNSWGQQDLCFFVTQYLPSSDMVKVS